MFRYDIELMANAITNIYNSLSKLESKKVNINNILNLRYKNYEDKESLEKVCEDLLEIIKEISDLKSDSEIMKKRITNIDLGDNIELESSVFSSDVVGTLKIGENLNVKDLNQDKYEVLGFDETIKSILNSQEFSEEEKEQFKNNYEKENYSALTFLMKIHNLNQELEVIEDEINKLTEEEYSKKEELNASKISKQQELYDTKKLLELAEFEYLDYLMESEDFIKLSNIESTASLAFAFLKKQDFSFSGINGPIEDIFMYLSLYVTNLRGDNGEYGLADRLYLEQIIKYLCKDEEFKEYLISVGVSSSIVSKEESLFASLIQYQQQGVSYAYTMMTEDEKSKLNYLYQTDKEEADKYVLALEDTLNSRYGYELAMRDVEAILKGETSVEEVFTSFGTGIIPGVRNFSDNTKAWLTGDDTKTYTDYQIEYVSQIISKIYYANGEITKEELDTFLNNKVITNEQYNQLSSNLNQTRLDVLLMTNQINEEEYNTLKEFGYNLDTENELVLSISNSIGVSIGNQLPSMLTSYATMGVTGSSDLAHTLANVMMFLSSSGASYKEAKWKGYDDGTSRLFGIISGASETATGYFLGKMPGISKMDHYMEDIKSIRKLLASLAWNSFQEGFEEFIQVDIEKVINSIILGEAIDLKLFTPEKGIAFISGFISSGMTQVTVQTASGLVDITYGEIVSYVKDGTIDINRFQSDLENNEIGSLSSSNIYSNASEVDALNKVLNSIDTKYGIGEGILYLNEYVKTGNINYITSFNGARDIVANLSFDSVKSFVNNYFTNNLNKVINIMDNKFSMGEGILRLKEYLKTGNINYITSDLGARAIVSKIPIEIINNFLQSFEVFKNTTSLKVDNLKQTFSKLNLEYLQYDTTLPEVRLPSNFDLKKYFSNKEFTVENMANIYNQIQADGFNMKPDELYLAFFKYTMDNFNYNQNVVYSSIPQVIVNEVKKRALHCANFKSESEYNRYITRTFAEFKTIYPNLNFDQKSFFKYFELLIQEYQKNIDTSHNKTIFLKNISNRDMNGHIGVDQGMFKSAYKGSEIYLRLLNKVKLEYGFTSLVESEKVLQLVDSRGACSYAGVATHIILEFRNKPDEFYRTFGFPLYVTDEQGNRVLNSGELLLDMYLFLNDKKNGGNLVGKKSIFDSTMVIKSDASNQKFLALGGMGQNVKLINRYLASKGANYRYDSKLAYSSITNNSYGNTNQLKQLVINNLNANNNIDLDLFSSSKFKSAVLTNIDDPRDVRIINGGHATTIVDYNEEGVIISTWGNLFKMSWNDLATCGVEISISSIRRVK